MNQGDSPPSPRIGLGCDLSTHKVHFAKVARQGPKDVIVALRQVDLDRLRMSEQVLAIRQALEELAPASLLVVEQPFVAYSDNRPPNFGSDLRLARVGGVVAACGAFAGLEVQELNASAWRSLVGVKAKGRVELKAAAIRLVRLQFDHETKDDNEAESILIAQAALMLAVEHGLAGRVR